MPTRETDPLNSFLFALDVQGTLTGYFTEISGLGSENEIVEQKIVSDKGVQIIKKIPGRLKFTDVTLKRGVTAQMDIWQWRKLVEEGNTQGARKNATITMYDQSLKPIAEWNLENAWPVKVTGPSLQSDSNALGIEEVQITFETMKRTK
jgi:phage tail-like protein